VDVGNRLESALVLLRVAGVQQAVPRRQHLIHDGLLVGAGRELDVGEGAAPPRVPLRGRAVDDLIGEVRAGRRVVGHGADGQRLVALVGAAWSEARGAEEQREGLAHGVDPPKEAFGERRGDYGPARRLERVGVAVDHLEPLEHVEEAIAGRHVVRPVGIQLEAVVTPRLRAVSLHKDGAPVVVERGGAGQPRHALFEAPRHEPVRPPVGVQRWRPDCVRVHAPDAVGAGVERVVARLHLEVERDDAGAGQRDGEAQAADQRVSEPATERAGGETERGAEHEQRRCSGEVSDGSHERSAV
jgi:hypothetical protein